MIMRKNPYEKIRRTLFILLFILLVTAACVIGVMLIKHTHNAEKNKVRETTAATENVTEKKLRRIQNIILMKTDILK